VIDPFANKSGQGQDDRHHQCPPATAHRQHAHHQHQRYEHRLDEIAAGDQFHERRHDEQQYHRNQEFRRRKAVKADTPGRGALGARWLWRGHDSIIHRPIKVSNRSMVS
jgi:hypothetical protein